MLYIQEALKRLNELVEKNDDNTKIININVFIESDYISEKLLSKQSNKFEDKYDDQTLEDWYDFASTVEGIVENYCSLVSISLSNNENSLSEYIDFYTYDEDGNQKDYLIDLRLSDHGSTSRTRQQRKKKVSRKDKNYKLISVIVNDKLFDSYESAIFYIRKMLAKESIDGG